MSKLLYYPYISIPNESWLIQALLYWDGIATIVPFDVLKSTSYISPFARQLIREEIIETVQPDEYAYSHSDDFLKFLDYAQKNSHYFSIDNTTTYRKVAKLHNIHIGKLGYIADELEKAGMAHRIDQQWYCVNDQLANAFMTFLAVLIGQKTNRIPTTDTYQGMSSLFNVEYQNPFKNSQIVRNAFRNSILENILPVPSNVQSLSDINTFKERYHTELIRFRRHIENFTMQISSINPEFQEEYCKNFLNNTKDEIEEIKGHMRFFNSPSIDVATLITAIPSIHQIIQKDYLGATLGLLPLLSEITLNTNRKTIRSKPLAYAALYQKRFHN